ncbi:hypothetical protein [Hymenobacter rubripertinctus]|uniref:Periplasmic heavy metal sensor n=1 Tax=Hymenobacter rubripertinctus TaxID=2029981 RepID=A0A418R8R2_9BACT|nr:hypothetical protein [Hymenobacter rubripertinctus]RIY13877.1 hypothetical protein D0T11_02000 [Hymenobacter rubripertinctus]
MKALLLILTLLGTVSTAAHAQMKDRYAERPGNPDPSAARVEDLTRQMSRQLRLNEAQYIQLRDVNKIKLARTEEISWQFQENPLERSVRLAELQAQYEAECGRILTPSQLSMLRSEQPEAVPVPAANEGGLG